MYINKKLKNTKQIVVELITTHLEWNATEIYKAYKDEIGSQNAVTLNAIQKIVHELRPKYEAKKDLNKPWTIGASAKYPELFPPESITQLLFYKKAIEKIAQQQKRNVKESRLTIRIAKWVVRLEPLVQELWPEWCKNNKTLDKLGLGQILLTFADRYALAESISEVLEEDFDTSELDSALLLGDITVLENTLLDIAISKGKASHKPKNKLRNKVPLPIFEFYNEKGE